MGSGDHGPGDRRGIIGILLGSAVVMAICSAVTYLMGYQNNVGYYSAFGINLASLKVSPAFHFLGVRLPVLVPYVYFLFAVAFVAPLWLLGFATVGRPFRRWKLALATVLGTAIFVIGFALRNEWITLLGIVVVVGLTAYSLLVADFRNPIWLTEIVATANRRRGRVLFIAPFVGLLIVLAFALVSTEIGASEARKVMREDSSLRHILLYSSSPLAIPNPTPIRISGEPPHMYKYDGLRLVIYNDQQYFVFRLVEVEDERPLIYVVPNSSLKHVELRKPMEPVGTPDFPTLIPPTTAPGQ